MTEKSLIELIDQAAARHGGVSGRRLAELAQHAGHDISHATLNRIRQGTYLSRPSDASIRAIAFLADVSENTAFAAAGVVAPTGVAYQAPPEAQRMNSRQRKAVTELIRAFAPAAREADSGVDYARLLGARDRLNSALQDGAVPPAVLADAARDAVACIDELADALFRAAAERGGDPANAGFSSESLGFDEEDGRARAVG
jgi:hypothetical protein